MNVSIIIFTLCIGYVLAINVTKEEEKDWLLKPYNEACRVKTGISEELMKSKEYPMDGSMDCYIACTLKSVGIMTGENEINENFVSAVASQYNSKEKLEKTIEICKEQMVSKDECERAGVLIRCFVNISIN